MNTHNLFALASLLTIASLSSGAAQAYYYNQPAVRRAQAQSAYAPYRSGQRLTNGYTTTHNAYTRPQQQQQQQQSQLAAYSRKTINNSGKYSASKSDVENAKFAGANNQETDNNYHDDGDARTASHLYRKRLRRLLQQKQQLLGSPCYPYGRDVGAAAKRDQHVTPPPKEQGRFLWDVNVYNVYPGQAGATGCGGYGGYGGFGGGLGGLGGGLGGLGGGLLSDPIGPLYPQTTPLTNFLNLFAPGILQNSLAVTRPLAYPIQQQQQQQQQIQSDETTDLQNDPAVDPSYAAPAQRPVPVRRPNRVYYDSAGAAPVTPGQLLGGVSTTVNGIIQQLTGNLQPVYPSYRTSRSYG